VRQLLAEHLQVVGGRTVRLFERYHNSPSAVPIVHLSLSRRLIGFGTPMLSTIT